MRTNYICKDRSKWLYHVVVKCILNNTFSCPNHITWQAIGRNVNEFGALCSSFDRIEQGLDLLQESITAVGLTPAEDFNIALQLSGPTIFDYVRSFKVHQITTHCKKSSSLMESMWWILGQGQVRGGNWRPEICRRTERLFGGRHRTLSSDYRHHWPYAACGELTLISNIIIAIMGLHRVVCVSTGTRGLDETVWARHRLLSRFVWPHVSSSWSISVRWDYTRVESQRKRSEGDQWKHGDATGWGQ